MKMIKIICCVFVVGLLSCKKGSVDGGGNNSGSTPTVRISDVTLTRSKTTSSFRFYVDLNNASSNKVTVAYNTVDGTAAAGRDFTAKSGTISIDAGQTEEFIDIDVLGDSLRKDDQQFYVQLSSPQNATLAVQKGTGTIVNSDGTYLPTDNSGYTTPNNYAGYTLAWSDEFSGTTLNDNYWNYETGGNGWGNNELENYTSRTKNVFLSNGNLIIEARKETVGSNNYTSGRITTQGKKQFQYGRMDIRAKLPVSKGMWPAIWMLGSNISQVGWPACGEADIMELVGSNAKQVVGSIHWKQGNGSAGTYNNVYNLASQDFSQQFHVYSLIWDVNSVQILVDDQLYVNATNLNVTSGTYPFNNPFFFILNVAVGGDWPGPPDNTTIFPQRMFVDYIRVFQK